MSIIIFLTPYLICAQTGPAGIGLRDGSSTLELWMDIDKGITTVDHTSTGGSTLDVSNWADQSGNGLNMTGNGTGVPEYISNFQNGHGVMQYVQSNFERLNLSTTISSIGSTDDRTFLYVFRFTSDINNNEIMGTTTGTSVDYGTFTVANDRLRLRNGGSNAYSALNSVTQSTWHVGVLSKNGTSVNAWNDDSNIINTTGDHLDWAVTNAYDLGAASFSGRSYQGEISELIIYSEAINSARRIILENYLAAKYNISLATDDVYDEDNAGSDFDYEIAGIGRVDASNIHDDAQGTSIIRILNPTGLGNDEFFIWGHNNGTLRGNELSDIPGGVQARLSRVWRVSEVNSSGTAVDVGSVDLRFDLTGLGTVVASDLRLLVDTNNNGVFSDETPVSSASSLGSNVYAFTTVSTIGNNMRFTLATTNKVQTPLPVKLLSFDLKQVEHDQIVINWSTAMERNNDFFTVQRSSDGYHYEPVSQFTSAQNSSITQRYSVTDFSPYSGLSYYKLTQTDVDGKFEILGVRSITNNPLVNMSVFPNPLKGTQLSIMLNTPSDAGEALVLSVRNIFGLEFFSQTCHISQQNKVVEISLPQKLASGIYVLQVLTSDGNVFFERKFLID